MVERSRDATYILFFTYRGVLDNFSGFMYRSDNTLPAEGDFGGNWAEKKRIDQNWFWVASH